MSSYPGCNVIVTSCNVALQCIQELLGAIFNIKNVVFNGEQEKSIMCEDGIEKPVPRDPSSHPRPRLVCPFLDGGPNVVDP